MGRVSYECVFGGEENDLAVDDDGEVTVEAAQEYEA